MLNYYLSPRKHQNLDRMFWNDFFAPVTDNRAMVTDVTETETEYLLDVELPGYSKDDVKVSYDEGYLTIEATRKSESKDENKNYIRRERHYGTQSRSWYVGNIDQSLIKAGFQDGILKVSVPKEQLPEKDTRQYISID